MIVRDSPNTTKVSARYHSRATYYSSLKWILKNSRAQAWSCCGLRPVQEGLMKKKIMALEGGSVGFQIGGQATDFVLLVMNDRGANGILSSK
jgi:hypothetical protein